MAWKMSGKNKCMQVCISIILLSCCVMLFSFNVYAISQNDVVSRLNILISQYNGKTWQNGSYGLGKQCYEFAHRVFNDLFGRGKKIVGRTNDPTCYKLDNLAGDIITLGILEPGYSAAALENLLEKAAPGDFIQVKRAQSKNPHSMIVVDIDEAGNRIKIFDANTDGKNGIKCYWQSFSEFAKKNMGVSVYRYSGYTPGPTSPPGSAQISQSQVWYDLGDTIDIYMKADNATNYYMSMFKDGQKIVSQNVDSGHFSMPASSYGTGEYSVYCSASNELGTTDSPWINFSVVGAANYSSISSAKQYYDLSDEVSLSVSTICAKGQVIGIDKEGSGRVITETCDATYTISASSLGVGKYSAYFSVFNGSGTTDTGRVEFEILDMLSDEARLDLGDRFFAYIEHQESGLYLTNQDNNEYHVIAQEAIGGMEQIWLFEKQADGAYMIQSLSDGGWLDVEKGYDGDGTNVLAYPEKNGQENQKFYLYDQCGAVYIKPLCSENRVLDVSFGSDNNLEIWYVNAGWRMQEFNIIKIEENYTVSYDAMGGNGGPEEQEKLKGIPLKLSDIVPQKTYTITYKENGGDVVEKEKKLEVIFNNWNTSKDGKGKTYTPGELYEGNENIRLYAQWKEIRAGSLIIPTREGYTFDGWYDVKTGIKIRDDTVLTGDITVEAHWIKAIRPGDVNEDGTVNTKDSVMLRKYILNGMKINEAAGDVDNNGRITSKDSILLRKYLLGDGVELL